MYKFSKLIKTLTTLLSEGPEIILMLHLKTWTRLSFLHHWTNG